MLKATGTFVGISFFFFFWQRWSHFFIAFFNLTKNLLSENVNFRNFLNILKVCQTSLKFSETYHQSTLDISDNHMHPLHTLLTARCPKWTSTSPSLICELLLTLMLAFQEKYNIRFSSMIANVPMEFSLSGMKTAAGVKLEARTCILGKLNKSTRNHSVHFEVVQWLQTDLGQYMYVQTKVS